MAEYIERENVTKIIDEEIHCAAVDDNEYGEEVLANLKDRIMREIHTADVVPAPKWISVKDRLPEYSRYVLMATKRDVFIGARHPRLRDNGGDIYITKEMGGVADFNDVLYWQSLPEPPHDTLE